MSGQPDPPLFTLTPDEAGLLADALNAYGSHAGHVPYARLEDAMALIVRLRVFRERHTPQ